MHENVQLRKTFLISERFILFYNDHIAIEEDDCNEQTLTLEVEIDDATAYQLGNETVEKYDILLETS